MAGVMEGVRVLEVAAWTYVPSAGGVLAEWGADVLKIEHPETGDPQRGLITSALFDEPASFDFIMNLPNRNKRSVGIDLATDDGQELLLELAKTADVFLTNFLPAARRRLRIDVDDIRAVNPEIIYVRGSGNGQRGPEAERGGYDNCTFWARSGPAAGATPTGSDYPVTMPSGAFGDVMGGLTIAGGICAALFHRERTGEAQTVDCSLLSMGAWAMGFAIAGSLAYGLDSMPTWSHDSPPNPVLNSYRTSDGRFLQLNFMQPDRYWPEFVEKIGHPELADDPRFADGKSRYENRQACVAVLDEIFATKTLADWSEILLDVEGVWSPVQTPAEVARDPQVVANDVIRDVVAEDGSTFQLIASPLQFGEQPATITRAPNHGEHTDEVLTELGLDMDEILDLKVKGAIL
jgi:crotonobetainyl-CoA:carnitine CoA-transferase CaiB-like acyl-CoA transferase